MYEMRVMQPSDGHTSHSYDARAPENHGFRSTACEST